MLEVPPAPWAYDKAWSAEGRTSIMLAADPPSRMVQPKVYGRAVRPVSDAPLDRWNAPPDLHVARLSDVVLLPRNIVLDQTSPRLRSPTFLRPDMTHTGSIRYLPETGLYELKREGNWAPPVTIDGPLYHLDTDFPGHYGHWLVDVFPRLWALELVPADVPIATSLAPHPTVLSILAKLGIPASRLVHIKGPVFARDVYFPDVAFHRRAWIHSAARKIFSRIATLSEDSSIRRRDRIYVSRSRVDRRRLMNEADLERLFKDAGFFIMHPQEYSIADQIALFAGAKMIAGAGGSAMHNTVFSPAAKVLIVCSEAWLANADTIINQRPGQLGYAFGEVLKQRGPRRGVSKRWRVDPDVVRLAMRRHFGVSPNPLVQTARKVKRKFKLLAGQ